MQESKSHQRRVTEKVEAGWRIEEETSDRVVLVKRNIGSPTVHVILAILTIWWAMGIPNLLYGLYKYIANSERTIIWKTETDTTESLRR